MDLLSDLLDAPRARGAFLMRVVMSPPWAIRISDEAPLTLMPQLSGRSWFRPDGDQAQLLEPGDVLLVRSPTPYSLSTHPDDEADITIGAGQACAGSDGRDLSAEMSSGIRVWGNDPAGGDQMLVGTYRHDGEVGRLLLGSVPPWLVVHNPAPELVSLLNQELTHDDVGQGGMLDRLLDLLLINTLRTWASQDDGAAGWLRTRSDPVVAEVLRSVHEHPERPWTVAELATRAGVSRAAMARRFTEAVGTSPMAYLTEWRLAVGADLLRDEELTLGAIARRIGYGSSFSFSTAFKKRYGVSPQEYRQDRSIGSASPSTSAVV
ncbi:MAG: AraC family transcriptional regulator [Actinomycetales bacterium]